MFTLQRGIFETKTSIIIPVHNQQFLTRLCLSSLKLAELGDAEIIVLDNGSTDGTAQYLTEWSGEDRRVLRSEKNLNFGPGCTWAASQAEGEILVFLNNDTFVFPDWLPALLSRFQPLVCRRPALGFSTPTVAYSTQA